MNEQKPIIRNIVVTFQHGKHTHKIIIILKIYREGLHKVASKVKDSDKKDTS